MIKANSRPARRCYENMDVVYAAMPDDETRALLVRMWHDAACGVDVRFAQRFIRELAGMWADCVAECRPDFDLLTRWRRDHGITRLV